MTGEFSVYQFFENGMCEKVRDHVDVAEAVSAAKHYTSNVASRLGIVHRVIITDGGEHCCFEWKHDQGVTFPPRVG